MFRSAEISAIARQISSRLTHPGWKKFKEEWERRSIARFLEDRDRELQDNPFLRPGGRFDAYHETRLFLSVMLQRLVDRAANDGVISGKRYIHAAIELADILGVAMPLPTPKHAQSKNWWSSFMPHEVEEWPAWETPPLPGALPETRALALMPSVSRTVASTSDTPLGNFLQQHGTPTAAPFYATPRPRNPQTEDARLAALQVLMTHPATSEQDRRSAMASYMRILASRGPQS